MDISFVTRQLNGQASALGGGNKINDSRRESANYQSFESVFNEVLNKSNSLILESEKLTEEIALGKTDNIHQVLIATEKADIALQLTLQMRNKILDAYNEIMRMQI